MTLFCNLPFSGPLQLISATRLKILIYLLQIKIKSSLIIDCVDYWSCDTGITEDH